MPKPLNATLRAALAGVPHHAPTTTTEPNPAACQELADAIADMLQELDTSSLREVDLGDPEHQKATAEELARGLADAGWQHRSEVLAEITDRLARRATLYGDSSTITEVIRDLHNLAGGDHATPQNGAQ